MVAVLLISPQCVKNFSDNFNKIHQQIPANFSEQLMNKTGFNSKIDFACYCPKCEVKIVFLFSKPKSAKQKGVETWWRPAFYTLFHYFAVIKTPLI